jgi:hypothetical protein
MERNRSVGEVVGLDVPPGELAQPAIGDQVVAPAAQAADERAHADREDVLALKVAPDSAERLRRRCGLRARGDERRVEGAGGTSHQHVGHDVVLIERLEYPDLQCPEARTTGQHERRVRP